MSDNERLSIGQKIESVLFPLAAGIVGIGYSVAIVVNNPISSLIRSPHALILLAIFLTIAFFPIRTLFKYLTDLGNNEQGNF